jgi:thymidine phosphorylase
VSDPVDHAVGVMVLARPGDLVRRGDPLFELQYRDRGRLDQALALIDRAATIDDAPPLPRPLIVSEVQ